ncbi:alpha-glucosidase [Leifsonia sp. NPDC056665]|uniref:alpha-glucosidase n=1 Tax=Leifsonia sp. NPDC056665 TaxID=3345901 RepID=UPI0036AE4DF4
MSETWWKSAVVYQVYPRSFADSDGDGIGDLRGIIQHLDHLQELGVDVVWLSPIYASPHDDNGYDISDYRAIDPLFGTFDDFDELLAGLHARGIKLVMDLVVNHTSDEHPWFIESASSLDSPKRDWYWWRPARDGREPGEHGGEPNNWGSFFSGPAWQLDPATGEYYLHLFSRKQPDLNWENPEVREAVYDMMNWWLDRGVDGFRMDVINFISKVVGLPDGDIPPGRLFGDGYPFFGQGPRIHEFLHEMHERVFAGRADRILTVGEMPGVSVEAARLFTDPARAELDMVFQFEHVDLDHGPGGKWDDRPASVLDLKRNLAKWQEGLADVGWNSLYWNNHDQPRVVSRFGDDRPEHRVASAKALATVLHLMRGTPYVYQGEELGMANVPFESIDDFRDIESLNHYAEAVDIQGQDAGTVMAALRRTSRDNARTPMQWSAAPAAGFTTGTPWIEANPDYVLVNAEAERRAPDSVFAHYRRLIELRHRSDVVADGDFTLVLADHPQLFAYTRERNGSRLLVLANLSGEPAHYDPAELDGWAGAALVLGNLDDSAGRGLSGSVEPWEALVFEGA